MEFCIKDPCNSTNLKTKQLFVLILGWPTSWSLGSWVTARFIQSLRLVVIHLWRPQKMTNFFTFFTFLKTIESANMWQIPRREYPTHFLCRRHWCMFPLSDHSFWICFVTALFAYIYFLKLIVNWQGPASQERHI